MKKGTREMGWAAAATEAQVRAGLCLFFYFFSVFLFLTLFVLQLFRPLMIFVKHVARPKIKSAFLVSARKWF